MNIYMLDTNIFSEAVKPEPDSSVVQKIAENIDTCCISSISWAEALTGVKQMPEGSRKNRLFSYLINEVQSLYEIIPFDSHAASIYSDISERLKAIGKPAQKFDLMIAASTIANGMILVTRNTKDFAEIREVSSLIVENWFEIGE